MCGIFGFKSIKPLAKSQWDEILTKGAKQIKHRGPDGEGFATSTKGNMGFAHVRLAIVDIDSGQQPMVSPDNRYMIIFNGEIYNYLELRREIGNNEFRTNSDTEVLLKAFEKWGADCLSKLRGMFAFMIWDNFTQELFIARDRVGIKPLYYAITENGLYFSSEIKGLLPFLRQKSLNQQALSEYFSFQMPLSNHSLITQVQQFPAAHYAIINHEELTPIRYWDVHYECNFHHKKEYFKENIREIFQESMDLHLRADVEIASYVSGGIDSSLIAALAHTNSPANKFKIFHGRFDYSRDFDESQYAKDLAKFHQLDYHEYTITEQDFVDNIASVIWHLDQPVAGPGSFSQYMISKHAAKFVKVILGGQGGDEIFGGYARYLIAYFEQCIKGAMEGTLHDGNFLVNYESIIPNLPSLNQYKPLMQEFFAKGMFESLDNRYFRLINRANNFANIIKPDVIDNQGALRLFGGIFNADNAKKNSYFDLMTHYDFKTLLPALLQVEDRMSMAHGLEARVPMLDHKLVEFVATIPADIKFKNGELKRLPKTIFGNILPASIVNRTDKMGFPTPINQWVRQGGAAREYIGDLFSSKRALHRDYINDLSVDKILDSQSEYGRNLWALLGLELWQQEFIDG